MIIGLGGLGFQGLGGLGFQGEGLRVLAFRARGLGFRAQGCSGLELGSQHAVTRT